MSISLDRVPRRWRSYILAVAGFCFMSPLTTAGAADEADPLIELTRARERAIVLSRIVRARLPPDSPAVVQAQLLHAEARGLTNLWLDGIKTSLIAGDNPENAASYKSRLEAAQKAQRTFVEHAEALVLPPEAQTKFFPGVENILFSLGKSMWQGLQAAQKKRAEDRERARKALIDEIETRKWPAFDSP